MDRHPQPADWATLLAPLRGATVARMYRRSTTPT
jgi:hypothetical protein